MCFNFSICVYERQIKNAAYCVLILNTHRIQTSELTWVIVWCYIIIAQSPQGNCCKKFNLLKLMKSTIYHIWLWVTSALIPSHSIAKHHTLHFKLPTKHFSPHKLWIEPQWPSMALWIIADGIVFWQPLSFKWIVQFIQWYFVTLDSLL